MKVNGYKLREAIKASGLELSTLVSTFEESMYLFPGEVKRPPDVIMFEITELEAKLARLQALQSDYNLRVMVDIGEGAPVSLEYTIKAVGGKGRASKMWREVAKGEKLERYERRHAQERDKEKEYATPVLPKEVALQYAKKAEKVANSYRMAIAKGNLTEIEFDESVADLFA